MNLIQLDNYIPSNSLSIWTQQLSNKSTTDVCLLISGAGAPAMFWTDEFCEYLVSAGYNVIRFDHRDQGLSDAVNWDNNPYTIDDLAKDVINILDFYNVEKAHIIGHSMGGMVAQWLAIAYPNRISTYTSISVATCGIRGQPPKEIMDILLENIPSQDFNKDLPAFMRSWKVLNGSFLLDEDMAIKYTQDLYLRSKHPVGVAWHHIWCEKEYIDLRDKLCRITVPGLFIHGELDPLVPAQAAIDTQAMTTHSKMIMIPGMGHMIFNRQLEKIVADKLICQFRSLNAL